MAAIRLSFFPFRKLSPKTLRICTSLCSQGVCKRFISTSNKNKDTTTIDEAILNKPKPIAKTKEEISKPMEWISYGFSYDSEADDRYKAKLVMFSSVTIAFVGGAFILAYMPDLRARDWLRRESYLELDRRERLGLPLINPDLVDLKDLVLPSDEELGDTEIII